MKAEADIDFIMGENQIICHGWPYSPPDEEVPEPGWSLYAAASFNNHNPWHPVMPAVTAYIGRMSYLMRQGEPANQVAILLPTDDAWAGFRPCRRPGHRGDVPPRSRLALMSAILSAGYNTDFIDAKAIDKVGLGTHQILVVPPPTASRWRRCARSPPSTEVGGKVIAVGRAPSHRSRRQDPARTDQPLEAALRPPTPPWSPTRPGPRRSPEPTPPSPTSSSAADDATKKPTRLHPSQASHGADIYFVINTGNQPLDTTATFATARKVAEAWDPDSPRLPRRFGNLAGHPPCALRVPRLRLQRHAIHGQARAAYPQAAYSTPTSAPHGRSPSPASISRSTKPT